MSDHCPNLSPLNAAANRQADALIRGINYQIWLSVEAWVNLRDDEMLYLEGLEDFDIITKDGAISVQPKRTSAPITLRSAAVTELLVNFWRGCRDNPTRTLKYRLVTTSLVGTEQASPLPAKGLEFWAECAKRGNLDKVRQLQSFLVNELSEKLTDHGADPKPDPSLLEFLKTGSPADVLSQLIRPITFETSAGEVEAVEESVAATVRAHGDRHKVPPSYCQPAVDRLFRITAATAGRQRDRRLTRDQFLQEFENATTQRITFAELDIIQRRSMRLALDAAPETAASFAIATTTEILVQRGVPELPSEILERANLTLDLAGKIRQTGVAVIRGSSGMGKSVLGQMVARSLSTDCLWADFQDVPADAIPQVCRAINLAFVQPGSPRNLVLDNLNFEPGDLASVENALATSARTARARGGWLLLTTQRDLPLTLQSRLGLTLDDILDVPRFNEADIAALCLQLGCPDLKLAEQWARLVGAHSSGHPRLVLARLLGLRSSGWPRPSGDDLLSPSLEIQGAQAVARQLLARAAPAERELLYRLSIASGPFRRDHAIALGQTDPAIAFPADGFDHLVGPWIDRLRSGYFRVSPLLRGAAVENWSENKILQTRRGLARAMLEADDKTTIEACEILFQGLLAKDKEVVSGVAVSLATAGLETLEQVAERFDWLTLLGRDTNRPIFSGDPLTNFLLRLVQFRVLSVTEPGKAHELCAIIDQEFATACPPLDDSLRAMWLNTALIYYRAEIPPRILIGYWAELYGLMTTLPELAALNLVEKETETHLPDLPATDLGGRLLLTILIRKFDDVQLIELADAVNALPPSARAAFIDYLPHLTFPLRLLIDRIWCRESERPSPDWARMLRNLAAFRELIVTWNQPHLVDCVARAESVIEDDYRGNPTRALEILTDAKSAGGSASRLIEDQMAFVLYRQKKYSEALDIWNRLLPDWRISQKTTDHSFFVASQRAGHAAAMGNDLINAIAIFGRAAEQATVAGATLFASTFPADIGLAEWKRGRQEQAIAKLAEAVTKLEAIVPEENSSNIVHRARKMVEQAVLWIRFDIGEIEPDQWEPAPGMCSIQEENKALLERPACPFDLLWCWLAEIEHHGRLGTGIFEQVWRRKAGSKFVVFRQSIIELKIRISIARAALDSFVRDADDLCQENARLAAHKAASQSLTEPDHPIEIPRMDALTVFARAVSAALVAAAAAKKDLRATVAAWRAEAKQLASETSIDQFLQELDSLLNVPEAALPLMTGMRTTIIGQTVVALRISRAFGLRTEDVFSAQARLLSFIQASPYRQEIEIPCCELIREKWRWFTANHTPLLNRAEAVPAIRKACSDNTRGLKLAARILLAAKEAVRVGVHNDTVAEWKTMATD